MSRPSGRDLFRLYRVRDWLHFLPLPLAGWFAGGRVSFTALIGGVLGWTFLLAYMSAINQAFDDRVDRARADKNPVGRGLRRRQAVLLSLPPAAFALLSVGVLSPAGLIPALLILVTATVYSAPPRLKSIPIVGTLWNAVIAVPGLFLADCPDIAGVPLRVFLGLFVLLLIASQLIHEAEDREDDRAGGIRTVATLAGMKGALTAAVVSLSLLPGAAWWLSAGLRERAAITGAVTVFAAVWVAVLAGRVYRGDSLALRTLRLRYRYSALITGLVIFVAATR